MSSKIYDDIIKSKKFVNSVLSETNSILSNKKEKLNDLDKSFNNAKDYDNNFENKLENSNESIKFENIEHIEHIDVKKNNNREKEMEMEIENDKNDISSIDFGSAQSIIIDNKQQRIKIVSYNFIFRKMTFLK